MSQSSSSQILHFDLSISLFTQPPAKHHLTRWSPYTNLASQGLRLRKATIFVDHCPEETMALAPSLLVHHRAYFGQTWLLKIEIVVNS